MPTFSHTNLFLFLVFNPGICASWGTKIVIIITNPDIHSHFANFKTLRGMKYTWAKIIIICTPRHMIATLESSS